MELSTTTGLTLGHIINKCLAGLAGMLGGFSLSVFWQPEKLRAQNRYIAGLIIGGIAVTASVALSGFVAMWIGFDLNNPDIALGLGYIIGALSVGVISFLANYFSRRENKDIVQIAEELKKEIARIEKPVKVDRIKLSRKVTPNKKAVSKKAVSKKTVSKKTVSKKNT